MPHSQPAALPPQAPLLTGAVLFSCLFLILLGAASSRSWAMVQSQTQSQTQLFGLPAAVANRPYATRVAAAPASGAGAKASEPTRPLWTDLTPAQRLALGPLASGWNGISEAQKRKWLALSTNFPKMSPPEQAKLHSRMSEWAALSPQQRVQARLNFGNTKEISADDKKAKWEAYQALSPEEKRQLAAGAARSPATAAAVKPVPPQKMTAVPKPQPNSKTPRIAAAPGQPDPNSLLPPQVLPAPPQSN